MPALTLRRVESMRLRIKVRGVAQGVGFRPFVYKLAQEMALAGYVRNDAAGVTLEIEGPRAHEFVEALRLRAPPLARIDGVDVEEAPPTFSRGFRIEASEGGEPLARISPDAPVCDACLDELFDPASRFYLYPFVNCPHCGPRYTITCGLPCDRAQTSMAAFPPCEDCAGDYADPSNRRFHAQGICCPRCGPKLDRPIDVLVARIRAGAIVALKGVGGYHLICDAANEGAVAELRRRKGRDAKPLAVMAANVASAARIGVVGDAERALLRSGARPIVLLETARALAPSLAPNLARIGVMLPHAPAHHLIFHAAANAPEGEARRSAALDFFIVATSANPSGAPLIVDDREAREKLAGVADVIVGHNREIVARADDSVMAMIAGAPALLRRARGFVPEPIALASDGPDVLALGAHQKTTVTVTRGREAFVSTHIGTLDNAETIGFFEETARRMAQMLGVRPRIVACDLHPDFHSTRYAQSYGRPIFRVQHHAAHIGAVAAEHGIEGPLLGAALDGYGLGDDGGAWGGELMLIQDGAWRRIGRLAPLPLPGNERAARQPWRMGVAALARLGRGAEAARKFPQQPLAAQAARLCLQPLAPQTTSLGRMFDAAAALLGLRMEQSYEGQAAMELEALCRTPQTMTNGFTLVNGALDLAPLLAALTNEAISPRQGAELFHGTLIEALAAWIGAAAVEFGHSRVALAGGCLMNAALADGLARRLSQRGLLPLLARKLPCNDGGLSLGQAYLARAALRGA